MGIQSNLNYTYRDIQHPGSSFKRSKSYLDGSAGIEKAIYKALGKENKSDKNSCHGEKILTMTIAENLRWVQGRSP